MKNYTAPIFVPIRLAGGGTGGTCKRSVNSTENVCIPALDLGSGKTTFTNENSECKIKDDPATVCYEIPLADYSIHTS